MNLYQDNTKMAMTKNVQCYTGDIVFKQIISVILVWLHSYSYIKSHVMSHMQFGNIIILFYHHNFNKC